VSPDAGLQDDAELVDHGVQGQHRLGQLVQASQPCLG